MKTKAIVITIIAIAGLALGAFFYFQNKSADVNWYTDQTNKAAFIKEDRWFIGSQEGYIRVNEDPNDVSKPSVLIKLKDQESSIEALGLDKAPEVSIEGKSMRRLDRSVEIPANPARPAQVVTLTQLLWIAPDGRQIVFEITPRQPVNELTASMEKIITSFKLLP